MEKQYCVCINFGNETTTASYLDLTAVYPANKEGTYYVPRLNILNGNTYEARKVETAIYRSYDGQWELATERECFTKKGIAIHFINKIERVSLEDKEHYTAFIRLVFQAIIANNSFLYFDNNNPENRNFDLYICSSGWSKYDTNDYNTVIEDYKKFFSTVLPMPVTLISREDAISFSFRSFNYQKRSLLIEINAATIDSIYDSPIEGKTIFSGTCNGVGHIARDIQNWCAETQETYKKAKSVIPIVLEETDNKNINWEMPVRHYIEENMEYFYCKNCSHLSLNLPCSRVLGDMLGDKVEEYDCQDILYHCNIREEVLNEILANYRLMLKNDFNKLHDSGIMPEVIILVNNVFPVPWIKELIKDIFKGIQIISRHGSHIVSDGIALYAYSNHRFQTTIKSKFTEIINREFSGTMQEFLLESCNNFIDKDITVPAFEKYENNIARINASLIKKHVSGEYTKKSKQ